MFNVDASLCEFKIVLVKFGLFSKNIGDEYLSGIYTVSCVGQGSVAPSALLIIICFVFPISRCRELLL